MVLRLGLVAVLAVSRTVEVGQFVAIDVERIAKIE